MPPDKEVDPVAKTLANWGEKARTGQLSAMGEARKPVDAQMARLKRELLAVKMERDLLKKAAGYFAKELL